MKYFLNTQSEFFHVACGALNITLPQWPHWYFVRHGVRKAVTHCVWRRKISCDKTNACIQSKIKIGGCATGL
jgi:hypothetical protein